MPKAKPYSGPVDDKLAAQLFSSTGKTVEEEPLFEALQETAAKLRQLVEIANDELERSAFTPILAEHLANQMNRKGKAMIWVTETGQVMLDISYEDAPGRKRQRTKPRLPLLDELKAKAAEMGVDISEFGIKRKKIWEHLKAVEAGETKGKPAKKSRRQSKPRRKAKDPKEATEATEATEAAAPEPEPEPEPPRVRVAEEPEEDDDPGPMSAGPDETKVSEPPEDADIPKRRGFVKTGDAVGPVVVESGGGAAAAKSAESQGRPDLRQLMHDSKDVDIADLLDSEPPKQ